MTSKGEKLGQFFVGGTAPAPLRPSGASHDEDQFARTEISAVKDREAIPGLRQSGPQAFLKRAFDWALAAVAILVMLLPMAAIAACIRILMGSPVFFRDTRTGRGGRLFTLWKFKTMRDEREVSGVLLSDHERLTPIGRLLRSTSLDELPQLWNVLRGEMSLVGPRPLLPQYLPLYSEKQMRRHDVQPGITGWAQVNGRNALTWEEKFELDVWYVDHWSFLLDLRILFMTVKCVVLRTGISHKGEATMPFFQGGSGPTGDGSPVGASGKPLTPLREGTDIPERSKKSGIEGSA
ncbi:MAG: sugar transferase [Terracidiphilus sp.]|jgi:lipopolysaccharide/colanic/teichoic acid biosynthesis glycosyltransferase